MNETKRCAHCGRDVNGRSRVCPFCGLALDEKLSTEPPGCPRCKSPLIQNNQEGGQYDVCPACGGLWLDRGEFHLATRESYVYNNSDFTSEYVRGPAKDPIGYIPCVRCGKMMNRKNFGRISGVIIDECGRHGVWLDAGELEKIRHFIADGGLEKSQDREIERNRTELLDLETKVDQTSLSHKVTHLWNIRRLIFGG